MQRSTSVSRTAPSSLISMGHIWTVLIIGGMIAIGWTFYRTDNSRAFAVAIPRG